MLSAGRGPAGWDTAGVDVPVSGRCDERFNAVAEEFVRNFGDRGEVGAGVCVMVDHRIVVELVGGWSDEERTIPWRPDTLVDMYSVGKSLVALLLLQLVDRGRVGLDDPIGSVWPEFAVAGKEPATVRQALCHRAGVPAIRERLTDEDLWDWRRMTQSVAATEAWWEPGARHAYHTNTYGHLIGELVRRLSGESCGARLRSLTGPLEADVWFGVPPGDQHRCADILWAGPSLVMDGSVDELTGDDLMVVLGYVNPPGYSSIGVVNSPAWRAAEIPSTNGHATARGIATIYDGLLRPGQLLSADLLGEATSAQSEGYCPVLGEEVTFGLGFAPTTPRRPFGPNRGSFGHFGTGGAVGFADPEAGVAFGYAMNHVIPRWQSTRNRALIDAVYRTL